MAFVMALSLLPLGAVAEVQAVPTVQSDAHDCTACDEQVTWIAWDKAGEVPTASGHYYLTVDVQTSDWLTLTNVDITLCLNGHTVTANGPEGKSADRIVGLKENATFTVTDCTATVDADGNYTAGKLTGGSLSAIMMRKESVNATFHMYGGILTGNQALSGGAVCVQGTGIFNLYGGEISGNTATEQGGGFYVSGAFVNVYGAPPGYGSTPDRRWNYRDLPSRPGAEIL